MAKLSYRSGTRLVPTVPDGTALFGFELEKSDGESQFDHRDFKEGFFFENDGSLPASGFEFVTPAFTESEDLDTTFGEKEKEAANQPVSDACGGHIHMSIKGASTSEENFNFFLPALALGLIIFRKRLTRPYCSGSRIPSRSSPVNFTNNHIEFRLPPGVPDFENLKWRHRLFATLKKILIASPPGEGGKTILDQINNKESELYALLAERISEEMIEEYSYVYPYAHELLAIAEDNLPNAWYCTKSIVVPDKQASRPRHAAKFAKKAPERIARLDKAAVISELSSSPLFQGLEERIKTLI